jgi:hypothetical protein
MILCAAPFFPAARGIRKGASSLELMSLHLD